ncbi:D-alanyl-D-alanine carboxypeptidase, partial [Streptomyces tanashiensis]
MPEPRTWQLTAGSAALGLVLAAAAVTAAGPWDGGQRTAERARAAAPTTGGTHHAPPPAPAAPRRPAPAPSAPRRHNPQHPPAGPGRGLDPVRVTRQPRPGLGHQRHGS